jgi:hypothetical protein
MLTAFTILASFSDDALTFTEEGRKPVSILYREHPDVFGHPRFFMADFDKGAALVRSALKELAGGRLPLIAPKIAVSFDRPIQGGVTEMDKKIVCEILTSAGARKVVWKYG